MISAIIVGAGHRALEYASLAKQIPEEFRIAGVADPNELRRKQVQSLYGFGDDMCFSSAEQLAEHKKCADCIINGTMDTEHVKTTIPLLERGYDVLLEKPFAVNLAEIDLLEEAVRRTGHKVMICHVLRYAPFYGRIKELILSGTIGEIFNIQTAELVSYHHIANCYVRGKWRREEQCGSGMLMAKCCHDLDLISWFMSGIQPVRVSSFGGLHYFCRSKAPANSGNYCLLDCPIEQNCDYSCRKLNLNFPKRWGMYVWTNIEGIKNPTPQDYETELKRKDNPYARCVWKSDNDVVDRQSVVIEFANGVTATHNMVGGCSRPGRKIHIIGSKGEIDGTLDDNSFQLRTMDTTTGIGYKEEKIDLKNEGDVTGAFGSHGGGDLRLAYDFYKMVRGEKTSIACTMLSDSINGHRIGFLAEMSRKNNQTMVFQAQSNSGRREER